jgi:chemotaxis protein methyltransferase CheR
LCHRGFLVLGSKETLEFSGYKDHFEPLVKQERIYRKS